MADYPTLALQFAGFSEDPKDFQTIRTEMEQGYVQTRAKVTTGPRMYAFSHPLLTAAEVATWVTFYDSCKGGALSFNFTDPRTSSTVICRFKSKPQIIPATYATYNIVNIQLEEAL